MLKYGYHGGERERTFRTTNFHCYNPWKVEGRYDMPTIDRCDVIPDRLIGFNYVKTARSFDCGVHFFIDDYQFERLWNYPLRMIPQLGKFQCAMTPDFSLYTDMPVAMKIWNTYRSRMLGQIMQSFGINVIPTLSWADQDTFHFCFDGLPVGGVVAVSTVGVVRDEVARHLWFAGMKEAMRRLSPSVVLHYGNPIGFDFGDTDVRYYSRRAIPSGKT